MGEFTDPSGTAEHRRLADDHACRTSWRQWGPYLSDRQWGTVHEDYSPEGQAWDYFPFAHAHRRAYRWVEDGLAGISDDRQRLCVALALWNGRDPILATPSSRSGSSDWRTRRGTMART